MSFSVHFSFSWGLSKALVVPAGTKAKALAHVQEVERILGLKQVPPGDGNIEANGPNYPAHWDYFGRDFSRIDEDLLCKTVEEHNAWVRFMYQQFEEWAKKPFVPTKTTKSEKLKPADAREFWHGFEIITLDAKFWNRDYYRARMESLYEVMRGRDSEGASWDGNKALTQQQAGNVIRLFEQFLDPDDMRLEVVQSPGRGFNGQDRLASSYDGGYEWCSGDDPRDRGCYKPIDYDCIGDCRRRNCPLKREPE
jgi:hypothetical protein